MSKYISIIIIIFFTACSVSNESKVGEINASYEPEKKLEQQDTSSSKLVGNDRDEHGCIQSVGYIWSALKNDCIRLFEVADCKLVSVSESNSDNFYVSIIFDSNKSKAELFLPNSQAIILNKQEENIWSKDSIKLQEKNGYKLIINGIETYHSK